MNEENRAFRVAPGAKVAIVTPLPNVRDAALYLAVARVLPDVRIFTPSSPQLQAWPENSRPIPLTTVNTGPTRQWMRGLRAATENFQPDLIHVHNEPWALTSQRMLSTGRPVVLHGAESIFTEAPVRYRLRRAWTGSALSRAAGYVNWGRTGLRAAERAGLPPSTPRAVISASPPDPAVFTWAPFVEPSGRLQLTFVGRLVPEKGVGTILRAMAAPQRRDAVTITVVGGGPLEAELRGQAARLGVDARFAGPLDAPGTHAAIASGHVLAVPSIDTPIRSEQWGRVVVEAMMTGRSVLTSDAGELPHLVGNPDWIFRQNDPESLGRALDVLIADPSLVAMRGHEAYERSQLFLPDVLAENLLRFWDEVLKHWHGRQQEARAK